jgi:DNA-binding MarR family transcriptional regulator
MSDPSRPVNPSPLWTTLSSLAVHAGLHQEAIADSLGLNVTDLRCIGIVWAEPGLTPGRLAEATGLTTGAVTGVLDRLERAGWITRALDPDDRRRTLIHVAYDRGPEAGAAYDPLEQAVAVIESGLGPDATAIVVDALRRIDAAIDQDTARLRASNRGGMVGTMFTAPARDATHGRLVFRSGAPRFALRAAPLGPESEMRAVAELTHTVLRIDGRTDPGELSHAAFSGPLPDVRTKGGEVIVSYKRRIDWRQREARIGLLRGVPWTIEISGGLSTLDADLRTVRLRDLSVSGSVDDVHLRLGVPDGTSRMRISGGVRDVVVELPSGAALRLGLTGGAKDIHFEQEHVRNAHGTVQLETREARTSADRFELDLSGGARSVRVRRA